MKMPANRSAAVSGPRLASASLPLAVALAAGLLLTSVTAPALAEYQWSDENGRMVYSDVPPPPGSRVSNLVRRGEKAGNEKAHAARFVTDAAGAGDAEGDAQAASTRTTAPDGTGTAATTITTTAPATTASAADAARAARRTPTLADQEMAFRKRQAERAEAEQKQAEKAETDRKMARACDDARANLRSLESGQRIGRTNEAGERVFLNDAERESRLRELRGDLASRC